MSLFSICSVPFHLQFLVIGLVQVCPDRSCPVHHQTPSTDPESSCMPCFEPPHVLPYHLIFVVLSLALEHWSLPTKLKKGASSHLPGESDQTLLCTMFYLSHQPASSKTYIKTLFCAGTRWWNKCPLISVQQSPWKPLNKATSSLSI